MSMRRLILFSIALTMVAPLAAAAQQPQAGAILIYSGTTGFRHDSIPAGIKAVGAMAARRGLTVVASENPAVFSSASLNRFKAIVLLSCTTDPKNPASEWLVGDRRDALQQFVRGGGGIVAIHAAADSHYHWPWYARLIGGRFTRHPPATPKGQVTVVAPSDPAVQGLPRSVERTDEWYYFEDYDPVSKVLVTLDPSSIGEQDTNPNPIAWTRQINDGRVFYTAMGHTTESYSEAFFLQHVANGLDWVLRRR
jgi:type 1 glutamine amidotransferase